MGSTTTMTSWCLRFSMSWAVGVRQNLASSVLLYSALVCWGVSPSRRPLRMLRLLRLLSSLGDRWCRVRAYPHHPPESQFPESTQHFPYPMLMSWPFPAKCDPRPLIFTCQTLFWPSCCLLLVYFWLPRASHRRRDLRCTLAPAMLPPWLRLSHSLESKPPMPLLPGHLAALAAPSWP